MSLCTHIGVEHYCTAFDRTGEHEVSCGSKLMFYLTIKIMSLSSETDNTFSSTNHKLIFRFFAKPFYKSLSCGTHSANWQIFLYSRDSRLCVLMSEQAARRQFILSLFLSYEIFLPPPAAGVSLRSWNYSGKSLISVLIRKTIGRKNAQILF